MRLVHDVALTVMFIEEFHPRARSRTFVSEFESTALEQQRHFLEREVTRQASEPFKQFLFLVNLSNFRCKCN